MDLLRILAQRLDAGEENLAVLFALRADNKLVWEAGNFEEALQTLLNSRPPVLRVTFASLNLAADLVHMNAKEQSIGDRFGFTAEEWAELYLSKKTQ
jgi:hypothetical protein